MPDQETSSQTISCPVCGEAEFNIRREQLKGAYRIVRCKGCGLAYTNPMPTDCISDNNQEIYDDWDYHDLFRKDLEAALAMARMEMTRQIRFWQSKKMLAAEPGRLLDIGCGAGHIMAAAQELGWEAVGTEIDRKAYEKTAEAWSLDIRPVSVTAAGFPESHFDWIRARYIFEHLGNPKPIVEELLRILKPGGILTIDVPNHEGLVSWWRTVTGREKGLGMAYGYLDPPIHVIGYSPRTLKLLLERAGFEAPFSFSVFPGSPTWRPECGRKGVARRPYLFVQWALSVIGRGGIAVTLGRKPMS